MPVKRLFGSASSSTKDLLLNVPCSIGKREAGCCCVSKKNNSLTLPPIFSQNGHMAISVGHMANVFFLFRCDSHSWFAGVPNVLELQ